MAQAQDYVIANADGASIRADLNTVLAAIASLNSGATEPANPQPFMPWGDTANNLIKIRNAANSSWVTLGSFSGTTWIPYRDGTALGDAAVRNTGILENTIPLIGAGNVVARSILQAMQGASPTENGLSGAVPQPLQGTTTRVLHADGNWKEVSFEGSLTAYIVLPIATGGEWLIQYGEASSASTNPITVTYPLAYSATPFVTGIPNSTSPRTATVSGRTATQFVARRFSAVDGVVTTDSVLWVAIGHRN